MTKKYDKEKGTLVATDQAPSAEQPATQPAPPAKPQGDLTFGQKRVRAGFNPSSNSLVDDIKQRSAELIDLCEQHKSSSSNTHSEAARLWSLAQTHYEDAAMWAVKAATGEN